MEMAYRVCLLHLQRDPCPISLVVPFGQMEVRPRMCEVVLQALLRQNACRYCTDSSELPRRAPAPDADEMGKPEVL